MKSRLKTIVGRCLAGGVIAAVGLSALAATRSNKAEITRNLDIFNALYKELQTNYVDSIDATKSINTAIVAMLEEIDPYTEYYPASEQDDIAMMTSGEYGGIGSIIMERPGKGVFISEPYEGTPAAKAGLKAGDLIVMVDNDSVLTWTSAAVKEKLTGQPGTPLRLLIKRPYVADSMMTVELEREKISLPAVPYYGVLRDNIGYINLSSFTDKAAPEVRDALLELKKDPRVKSIVLDLRGNGGGLLEHAVKIVGMFVPKGTEVLRTRGKGQMSEKVYKTTQSPIDTSIPLVVLINGGSASASEITAGALQDLDRAVIIGGRSFGKGLVQQTRPIPYDGILKVTVAKYYIPSGRLIQAIDYSNRNPDGSVARIPDSLTRVWHTAGGREVRDGGGITPDIEVKYRDLNRLTYNILADNWAFDYATRYAASHPTLVPAEEFVVTDSIFADFKQTIDPGKFNYDRVCEQMLKKLRTTAETEGYMNDSTRREFDILETMLKHDLSHDLDNNRAAIEELIAAEIQKRYYFQKGQIIESLKRDEVIDSAANLLADPKRYRDILAPAGKK